MKAKSQLDSHTQTDRNKYIDFDKVAEKWSERRRKYINEIVKHFKEFRKSIVHLHLAIEQYFLSFPPTRFVLLMPCCVRIFTQIL